VQHPAPAHRRKNGEWRDLQLPLYTLLARELGLAGDPSLGYFKIGKDESEAGVALAPWSALDIESALEAAREVVRRIRRGEFFEIGDFGDDPIRLALAGIGLVESAEDSDPIEGGGEAAS
jgi:hypothetical protein